MAVTLPNPDPFVANEYRPFEARHVSNGGAPPPPPTQYHWLWADSANIALAGDSGLIVLESG